MLNSIWIELHQEMPRHPKTLALAQALNVSRHEAVGILADLWTWSLSCAGEDGELKSVTDMGIAMAVDFPVKRAPALAKALVATGWLDQLESGGYQLHDWSDYTGRLAEKRKDADRKRAARKKSKSTKSPEKSNGQESENPQNVHGQSADVPRKNTVNPRAGITEPNQYLNLPTPFDKGAECDSENLDNRDFEEALQKFTSSVKANPSGADQRLLAQLLLKFGRDKVLYAIAEASARSGHSVGYVRSILESQPPAGSASPTGERNASGTGKLPAYMEEFE